jgi:NAD(P)-dependent dehydrogenase (short-subunit alcohol dehydrogenase family)
MKIDGAVALVTGANRGLGQVYARELVARGAAKVYGAARNPAAVTEPGVTPVALDITDPDRVAQVAAQCADVTLLVNNAGVLKYSTFTGAPSLDAARAEMETNYFGTLSMCRAFAPVLAANGGGVIVNMLSVTSFYSNGIRPHADTAGAGWPGRGGGGRVRVPRLRRRLVHPRHHAGHRRRPARGDVRDLGQRGQQSPLRRQPGEPWETHYAQRISDHFSSSER